MERWTYPTAGELASALRAGDVTSTELTEQAIERIEQADGALNAVCAPDFERARAAAREADLALARGAHGRGGEGGARGELGRRRPLLGVPVTVKESFDAVGLPTTWGNPEFRGHLAAEDALLVERMRAAGAVVLGKTNVPLGLRDIQTYNEIHGTTNNPWDLARTPGGSSGGSAAALAAGFGALSLGSDIGGSLRTPAHFCGVHAHKPTLHLLPTRGMSPPPGPALPTDIELAVAGPMARSAGDLTLLLDVLLGPDPLTRGRSDTTALPPARHQRLDGFRVLVLDEHPLLPTGADVRAGIARTADALADGGARVVRHSPLLPDLAEAAELYMLLLFAISTARFPAAAYEQVRSLAAELGADDRSLHAARLRGATLSHRDWLAADHRRELHRRSWRRLFTEFDAVVAPITPTAAFPHHQDPDLLNRRITIAGTDHRYLDQLVWAGLATMPGLPATAVPTGPSTEGLPVGVQLIGPMYEDRTPLRLAELLEEHLGGFRPPPPRPADR
ncbi:MULTISPECIES: amidase [Kitasatospora]|uniref:Putative amidase n=1 Tax=Kitasatospora setae (strain ATCC 33774 / DSM 43861 / JCM 3304 / KCC A-0304 / NBRC 14216 / KM-6054) TaxID=452652 RepID=E4N6S6_KITSK|nr:MULTISPECIES: amidase [Kitasatospora]BAJ26907.1 putative amidase [Kitasatospora setae KM-6054]